MQRREPEQLAAYSGIIMQVEIMLAPRQPSAEFLKKVLPELKNEADPALSTIYQQICDGVFSPASETTKMAVIPYQLQMREVDAILTNARLIYRFSPRRRTTALPRRKD